MKNIVYTFLILFTCAVHSYSADSDGPLNSESPSAAPCTRTFSSQEKLNATMAKHLLQAHEEVFSKGDKHWRYPGKGESIESQSKYWSKLSEITSGLIRGVLGISLNTNSIPQSHYPSLFILHFFVSIISGGDREFLMKRIPLVKIE